MLLVVTKVNKTEVKMNKLVYLGLSILDNSNIEINEYSMAMQNQSAEIRQN